VRCGSGLGGIRGTKRSFVERIGLEPTTPGLQSRCSTN
jgi:hypothetical protein